MSTRRTAICVALALATLTWGVLQGYAQSQELAVPPERQQPALDALNRRASRVTSAQRTAAALARKAAVAQTKQAKQPGQTASPLAAPVEATVSAVAPLAAGATAMPMPGGTPNYFGPESNWAYSPQPTITTAGLTGGIRKFVDSLPGLTPAGANNLGQYVSIAHPDTITYPGSDYYEIELREYAEKMHSDLNPTTLRGYVQVNNGTDTSGTNTIAPDPIHYLGPLIIAQKDRAVRVKFTNNLATGAGGDLFLPVDITEMGAGMGPLGMNVTPGNDMNYKQNRGTLHLHGGRTIWISDGTPHQWTTPAGDNTDYPKGVSARNVPDMPDPGPGAITFFYSNQQSARLMFYHDHAFGITRLNVYAGEAAGYLLTDPTEQDLIARGILPDVGIPLVVQDRTFVDTATVLATDPTWPFPLDPTKSNLWYPHVYMTNQNPNALDGINPFGRWDYGPWFWPPWPASNPPITDPVTGMVYPNVPNLSMTMEAFHDTPIVNGTVYPNLTVQPKAYRFRILNAANDRMWNLQLYQASSIVGTLTLTNPGSGYTFVPMVAITPAPGDTTGHGATALATLDPVTGTLASVDLVTVGSGYTLPPVVTVAPPSTVGGTTATAVATVYTSATEVGMVPALPGAASFPLAWTVQTPGQPGDILDGRWGGVPDPALIGPSMIQIANEGGFLPAPAIWPNIPVGFDRDPKSITVGNVKEHNLFLGGAERADVIVDFSAYAGKTLILYNDAPAALPAADVRLDYYSCNLDQTAIGGSVPTKPGYGPNTRTIMRIQVANTTASLPYNMAALRAEFASTSATLGVFARSQDPIIVPQAPYNSAYNGTFPAGTTAYERINSLSLTFNPLDLTQPNKLSTSSLTIVNKPKAIAEEFESIYGRMAAFLGVEVPFTNGMNQTTIFYDYIDPPTELINDNMIPMSPVAGDGTQIWKITHNGVDTHPVHFHLFDVQIINRVDWAGVVKPPEPNELGWKETVRMNPLEDCIVALRPCAPKQPFGLPDSVRPLDVTMPIGSTGQFKNVDPLGNPITVINDLVNFGWEYVWHCHLLSHEEMDMMRPVVFNVARTLPTAPVLSVAVGVSGAVNLTWTDSTPASDPATWGNPANEIGFRIERATNGGAFVTLAMALANATSYVDTAIDPAAWYMYRVVAYNAAGESVSNIGSLLSVPGAPTAVTAVAGNARATVSFLAPASNGGLPILFYTAISSPGNIATTGPASPIIVLGLTNGTTYTFTVTATNAIGPGPASAPSNAVVPLPPPPAAPNNLRATASAPGVNPITVRLVWGDNSNNESAFLIERALGAGAFVQIAQVGANVTSWVDATVLPLTVYRYRVRATNLGGNSAYSNTASVTTPSNAPPAAPAQLQINGVGNTWINLAWQDMSNNETGFQLQRSTTATGPWTLLPTTAANVTQYRDNGLARRTTYYYQVRSVNGWGVSAWIPLTPVSGSTR